MTQKAGHQGAAVEPVARSDRGARVFVWSVWLIMMLFALACIAKYGRNIPLAEDWQLVAPLTGHCASFRSRPLHCLFCLGALWFAQILHSRPERTLVRDVPFDSLQYNGGISMAGLVSGRDEYTRAGFVSGNSPFPPYQTPSRIPDSLVG